MCIKETCRRYLPTALAVLLPLLLLSLLRICLLCPDGEIDPDAFYHASLAEQGPKVFLAKEFPAASMSIWSRHFSDKELSFHFLLWGIFRVRSFLGLSNACPFHFPVLFCCAGLLLALALLFRYWQVPLPWVPALLLVSGYYAFTLRVLFLRAYLLAMMLLILTVFLLSINTWRHQSQRLWLLLALGAVYSWSYSNPHFILIPVFAFAVSEAIATGRWRPLWLLPACAAAGVLLGLVLHPQFPNTLLITKIQCWDVLLMFLGWGKAGAFRGGSEFYLSTWSTLPQAPLLLGLPLLLALLYYWSGGNFFRPGWRQRRVGNAVLILAVGTSLGFLWLFRFAEFALISLAMLLALAIRSACRQSVSARRRWLLLAILLLYTTAAVLTVCPPLRSLQGKNHRPFTGVAEWVRTNQLPPGSIIANLRWGSFPMLYYALPEYRFLNGLDPMFAYAADPGKAQFVEDVLRQRIIPEPAEMRAQTGAKVVHISSDNVDLARSFWQAGYPRLYEGWDGWLFSCE